MPTEENELPVLHDPFSGQLTVERADGCTDHGAIRSLVVVFARFHHRLDMYTDKSRITHNLPPLFHVPISASVSVYVNRLDTSRSRTE